MKENTPLRIFLSFKTKRGIWKTTEQLQPLIKKLEGILETEEYQKLVTLYEVREEDNSVRFREYTKQLTTKYSKQ